MARVLITRAAEDAVPVASLLRQLEHTPVCVPLLERQWDLLPLAELAQKEAPFDWIVFTSVTTVDVFSAAAPGAWLRSRIAAVGTTTAQRLASIGRAPDLVPARFTGAAMVDAMGSLQGKTVLYPKGDLAPEATAQEMRDAGATVVEVTVYQNVRPSGHAAALQAALPVDVTTLLSGSAARRLREAWQGDDAALGRVIAIGPSTEAVARSVGLPVHQVARPHTLSAVLALVDAPDQGRLASP